MKGEQKRAGSSQSEGKGESQSEGDGNGKGKSEGEGEGKVLTKNVILRAKDKVQSLKMRSELQRGSETRGEVLLVFLVCTGEYLYYVIF
jgi:hypothetical protein